jgi:hypothetical protein
MTTSPQLYTKSVERGLEGRTAMNHALAPLLSPFNESAVGKHLRSYLNCNGQATYILPVFYKQLFMQYPDCSKFPYI